MNAALLRHSSTDFLPDTRVRARTAGRTQPRKSVVHSTVEQVQLKPGIGRLHSTLARGDWIETALWCVFSSLILGGSLLALLK